MGLTEIPCAKFLSECLAHSQYPKSSPDVIEGVPNTVSLSRAGTVSFLIFYFIFLAHERSQYLLAELMNNSGCPINADRVDLNPIPPCGLKVIALERTGIQRDILTR